MIERLEEQLAYENPWVKLYFDRVKFPNGKEGKYNRVVENDNKVGVVLIPIRQGRIGLVQLYRYPIGQMAWELPRGFAQTGVPRDDAAQELLEETGYALQPEQLVDLGPVFPNSGMLSTELRIFAADCGLAEAGDIQDTVEISKFQWFTMEELNVMIADFEISDAISLSALYRYQLSSVAK